jgi:hypothetical protein
VSGGGEEGRTGSGSRGAGARRFGRNVVKVDGVKVEVDHSGKVHVEGSEGRDGVSTAQPPKAVGLKAVGVGENSGATETGGKRACEARLLVSQGGRRGFGLRGAYAMSKVTKRVSKRKFDDGVGLGSRVASVPASERISAAFVSRAAPALKRGRERENVGGKVEGGTEGGRGVKRSLPGVDHKSNGGAGSGGGGGREGEGGCRERVPGQCREARLGGGAEEALGGGGVAGGGRDGENGPGGERKGGTEDGERGGGKEGRHVSHFLGTLKKPRGEQRDARGVNGERRRSREAEDDEKEAKRRGAVSENESNSSNCVDEGGGACATSKGETGWEVRNGSVGGVGSEGRGKKRKSSSASDPVCLCCMPIYLHTHTHACTRVHTHTKHTAFSR